MERLRAGVNHLRYLAVVATFMGLAGAKNLVRLGCFKVIILGRVSYKEGRTNFFLSFFFEGRAGGGMNPLKAMGPSNYY